MPRPLSLRARVAVGALASSLVVSIFALAPAPPAGGAETAAAGSASDPVLDTIVHNLSESPSTDSNLMSAASEGDDTYVAWLEGNRVAVSTVREHGMVEGSRVLVDPEGPGRVVPEEPAIVALGDDVYVAWSEAVRDPNEARYDRWVWETFLAVSHDRGRTFGPAEQVSSAGGDYAYDARLAVTDEVVALAWSASTGIWFAARPTAGGPWTEERVGSAVNGEYAIAAEGPTVQVVWVHGAVKTRRLPRPGATLTAPVTVGDENKGAGHADLAMRDGLVAIGWIEYSTSQGYHPVRVAVSEDGRSFAVTQVNDLEHSCGKVCGGWGPQVGIANGKVHAAYGSAPGGMWEAVVHHGEMTGLRPVGGVPALGEVRDLLATDQAVVVAYTQIDPVTRRMAAYDAARRHGGGDWIKRRVSFDGLGSEPVLSPLGTGGDYTTAWVEYVLDGATAADTEVLVRPASMSDPDLEAVSVQPIQAAEDAERLVAGKPTAFRAEVRSGFPSRQRAIVHWTVDTGDGELLEDATEHVLRPGLQTITYTPPDPFEVEAGSVAVSVSLDSTKQVRETDEGNNDADHEGLPVVDAEAHDVLYVPLTQGSMTTPCRDVRVMAASSEDFMEAVWPADPDASFSTPSCTTQVELADGPAQPFGDVLASFGDQLEGVLGQWEQVVVVVPKGWLYENIEEVPVPEVFGIANAGSGGGVIIVEAHGVGGTLATHELAHDLLWVTGDMDTGGGHAADHPAPGFWVERSIAVDEHDFMHPSMDEGHALQAWVSSETWEHLLVPAGQTSGLAASDGGLAVHGTVGADGQVTAGTWRSVEAPPTPDQPGADGDLVEVVVLDDAGDVLAERAFGLSRADHGDADPSAPRAFRGVVPVPDGAAAVEVRVDGEAKLRRERSANAPTVTLAGALPGTVVSGQQVPVSWIAEDADGDPVSVDVELSTDDGTTWVPVRSGVTEGATTLTITPELAGTIRVRVTATDGWHIASATSDGIEIESEGVSNGRVVFERSEPDGSGNGSLWTSAADGSDQQLLLERQDDPGTTNGGALGAASWSPDGSQLAVDTGEGKGLAVVDPDGTGLRFLGLREQLPESRTTCPTWSPDGTEIAFVESYPDPDDGDGHATRIQAIRPDGTGLRELVGPDVLQIAIVAGCPFDWRAGPEGERFFIAGTTGVNRWAILSMRPDGTDVRTHDLGSTAKQLLAFDVSRDGAHLAYVHNLTERNEQVMVTPTAGGPSVPLTDLPWTQEEAVRAHEMVWAPDGSSLLIRADVTRWNGGNTTWTQRLERIDALSGERTPFPQPDGGFQGWPDWQPVFGTGAEPDPTPELVARIGRVAGAVEGDTVALDARSSTVSGGLVEARWDLDGDGDHDDATGLEATTTFPQDGPTPVSVLLTDELGQVATATSVVDVANAAPAIVQSTATVRDGRSSLHASVEDPGADALTAQVTWPDGSTTPASTVRGEHGRWEVSASTGTADGGVALLEVDDLDGGTDSAPVELVFALSNLIPTTWAVEADTSTGMPVALEFEAVDPDGPAMAVRLEVVGQPAHGSATARHGSLRATYVPEAGFVGTDTFRVVAVDERGGRSVPVVATVRVAGVTAPSDATAPTVTITAPVQGAKVKVGSPLTAAYSCADDSGSVASCEGPVASGAAIDTRTAGPASFTVTAKDAAGNVGTATVAYEVVAESQPPTPPCAPRGGFLVQLLCQLVKVVKVLTGGLRPS